MRLPLALLLCLSGCASAAGPYLDEMPDAKVSTATEVHEWAVSANPSDQLFEATFVLMLVEQEPDGPCPARREAAGAVIWTGGCTDADGERWVGRARVRRTPTRVDLDLEDFGAHDLATGCEGEDGVAFDGRVQLRRVDGGTSFDVDLVTRMLAVDKDTCEAQTDVLVVDYRGHTNQDLLSDEPGAAGMASWSGGGRIGQTGLGVVAVRTVDQRLDRGVCPTEYLSGRTELESDGHVVQIRYDGERDCDEAKTVTWELDGQAMGELEDVGLSCQLVALDDRRGPAGLGLIVLVGCLVRRRKTET